MAGAIDVVPTSDSVRMGPTDPTVLPSQPIVREEPYFAIDLDDTDEVDQADCDLVLKPCDSLSKPCDPVMEAALEGGRPVIAVASRSTSLVRAENSFNSTVSTRFKETVLQPLARVPSWLTPSLQAPTTVSAASLCSAHGVNSLKSRLSFYGSKDATISQAADQMVWRMRVRRMILLAVCSVPVMFYALHIYVHYIERAPEAVCPVSSLSVGVEIYGLTVEEFIRRQLLMNIIFLFLILPPTVMVMWSSVTHDEIHLARFGIMGYFYSLFCTLQYCLQLTGWCVHVPFVAALVALMALSCRIAVCFVVWGRVKALEDAMLRQLGWRVMKGIAIADLFFMLAVFVRMVLVPNPSGWMFVMSVCLDWIALAFLWLFFIMALRSFLLAGLLIRRVGQDAHANVEITSSEIQDGLTRDVSSNRTMDSLKSAVQGDEVSQALKCCIHQFFGILLSFGSTVAFITSWAISNGMYPVGPLPDTYAAFLAYSSIPDSADIYLNLIAGVLFAGDFKLNKKNLLRKEVRELLRKGKQRGFRESVQPEESDEWQQKVVELAGRAVSLRALLAFYKGLGQNYMLHYDPRISTTKDVARQAVIPLSASKGCALAEIMMNGEVTFPDALISHNWGNRFSELVAAIIADAVGDDTYEWSWAMLHEKPKLLHKMLERKGLLDKAFWVCVFAVNQHVSICHRSRDVDQVTGEPHPACSCGVPKHHNTSEPLCRGRSILCEMNKFDDMMACLSSQNKSFYHVVAVDQDMDIFLRAWVIAEVALAYRIGLQEYLVPFNAAVVQRNLQKVQGLRVEDMQAARQEDVDEILGKIQDKAAFTEELKALILSKVHDWCALDVRGKVKRVGRVARMGLGLHGLEPRSFKSIEASLDRRGVDEPADHGA